MAILLVIVTFHRLNLYSLAKCPRQVHGTELALVPLISCCLKPLLLIEFHLSWREICRRLCVSSPPPPNAELSVILYTQNPSPLNSELIFFFLQPPSLSSEFGIPRTPSPSILNCFPGPPTSFKNGTVLRGVGWGGGGVP